MEASGDMQDLYRELVLDHSRNPRHFGRIDDATHTANGINPLCGDKLTLYFHVDEEGLIQASSFEGSGCAISVASASLMTEAVTGLPVNEADTCATVVTDRLVSSNPNSDLGNNLQNLKALDGVRAYPSRIKCATLAWSALHSALNNDPAPATTE